MTLAERKFIIGKYADCDVVLSDDSVSRRHAELIVVDGKLVLIDRHSLNGTYIIKDGKTRKITQELVQASDKVQFGTVRYELRELLSYIQRKHPGLQLTGSLKSVVPEQKGEMNYVQGQELIRCECGVVKVKGNQCHTCGLI